MASGVSSAVLSVGISEAHSVRRNAQRGQADSPAFQESDVKLSRTKEAAQDGRNAPNVALTSGKNGFTREATPEQRKEAEVIRRGDNRVRPYESAYLTRNYGAVASSGNFAVTYGADGKLSTTANLVDGIGKPAVSASKAVEKIRQQESPIVVGSQNAAGAINAPGPLPNTSAATSTVGPSAPQKIPDPPSVTEAGKSFAPPPRIVAEAQVQEKIQSAVESRTEREERSIKQTAQTEAVRVEAKRNGEAQNIEPVSPSELASALVRQRLADMYQAVPRDVAATISLFV